jgi:hypothetical protein
MPAPRRVEVSKKDQTAIERITVGPSRERGAGRRLRPAAGGIREALPLCRKGSDMNEASIGGKPMGPRNGE